MASERSPGPWRYLEADGVIVTPDVPGVQAAHEILWTAADCRLVAAAPELLAIAKRVYREIGAYHKDFDARLWVELERAIAKAEGRTILDARKELNGRDSESL